LPAIFALAVLRELARRGQPAAAVLRHAGLSDELLRDPEVLLPIETIFSVWEATMRQVRDDGLPIAIGKTFALADYPILGFTVMTAPSCREALRRVIRFSAIVTTSGRWSLDESGGDARLCWHREGRRDLGHRAANESLVAELVYALRQVVGQEVPIVGVSFQHAAPRDTRAHREHFGCRIAWDAERDEILLSRAVLDAVPRAANGALFAHFEAQAEHALAGLAISDSLAERVRRAIEVALPAGEPAASAIAKQLAMSERSLRRGLAIEGTSFRAIVDAVRSARAEQLLARGRASLAEIALALGFSELSAFSRAFKRWTGLTPGRARAGTTLGVV